MSATDIGFRAHLALWLDRPIIRNTIIDVIVFNAVILGMDGNIAQHHGCGRSVDLGA